jgi:SAM-dependent methyltransferase
VEKFNIYEEGSYAKAYAKLEFPATYYLAFRDLPEIISRHVSGKKALDFGCGSGRSTRFLKDLGFDVIGIDISSEMLENAREKDPEGDYRLVYGTDFSGLVSNSFDLILSAFPFDNIKNLETKIEILKGLGPLLNEKGRIVNLVSAPEIYVNEWASFSTKDFPENKSAKSGDEVRIINRAIEDATPVRDIFMTDEAYRDVYHSAGLEVIQVHHPLGKPEEPYTWVIETTISPWSIYVLKPLES